jgi:dihydropteroate synthase
MDRERILFVTGRLAEPSLRRMLADLSAAVGFDAEVAALEISVAALMTPEWVARRLKVPDGTARVILPGHCRGDLTALRQHTGASVEQGPEDLRDLPAYFGRDCERPDDYGQFDLKILAEINHAPRLAWPEILHHARRFQNEGADVIDVGCDPGETWSGLAETIRRLVDEGFRVSVDSFDAGEIEAAVAAGAELVLSINPTNLPVARDLGCEVVALADNAGSLDGLDATLEQLDAWGTPFRIDPVVEPIGFGFAQSLGRYLEARRRWPEAEMMMGVGNLTELTDVDSAGINVLLAGFCQELGIRSVLTTAVIPWAQSSVREIDLARRLMYHACRHRVLPKRLEPRLVMLRDEKTYDYGPAALEELARGIKDPNFRLFAEGGKLHAMNRAGYWQSDDPFALFDLMQSAGPVSASHAFYLGYELAKAVTALTLAKQYRQDQALDWGFLTRPERTHRPARPRKPGRRQGPDDANPTKE